MMRSCVLSSLVIVLLACSDLRANPRGRPVVSQPSPHHHHRGGGIPPHRHAVGPPVPYGTSFYFGSLGLGIQSFNGTYFGYGSPWLGDFGYSTYRGWPAPYGWSGYYAPGYYASDYFGTTISSTMYSGTSFQGLGLLNAGASGWGLDPLAGTTVVDSRPVIVVAPGAKDSKPAEEAKPAEPPLVIRSRTRESPPAARKRCERYVEIGDRFFRQQQYEDAISQYKNAAAAAPDMGLPLYRQTLAYIATRRFDTAIKTLRRAVLVDPESVRNRIALDELYAEQIAARNSHQELLAQRALETPEDPTPLLLLGLLMHFEGDAARAERFFRAAEMLLPPGDELIAAFIGNET